MKRFILLTPSIGHMGGAEMYAKNKMAYLKSQGWNVTLYYYLESDVMIPELKPYENNRISEMSYHFTYLSKKRRKKILDFICKEIPNEDEVVVEANLYPLIFWGEMIAQRTGGKNIIACLEEIIGPVSYRESRYLDFKIKRNEILNISSEKSIKAYFGKYYKKEYSQFVHSYMGLPFCSNVVENIEIDLSKIPPADYTILSIGRLDKPYVMPMFESIGKFAFINLDKNINILVVGGSPHGDVELRIEEWQKCFSNINLVRFGYLFPIPQKIIQKADVGIASSNSVLVISEQGVPTISIAIDDQKPLGIYGYTTNNVGRRKNESTLTIEDLLQSILVERKYIKTPPQKNEDKTEEVFSKHIEFINRTQQVGTYYPIESLYPIQVYLWNHVKWMTHKLFK